MRPLAQLLERLPGSVEVLQGTSRTFGLLTITSKTFDDGGGKLQVMGEEIQLVIEPGSILSTSKGALLQAGGAPYKVSKPIFRADGSLLLYLENA